MSRNRIVNNARKIKNHPKFNITALVVSGLCFVVAGYFIISGMAASTIAHPDGTLVKIKDDPADIDKENIYLIRDSQLFLFPSIKAKGSQGQAVYSDKILASYGYDRSKAKIATERDKQLPKTYNSQTLQFTFKEGSVLFDGVSYWMIDEDTSSPLPKTTRHKIVDPLKYGNALGYNLLTWKYDIVQVTADELSKVGSAGKDITSYDRHADGVVIRSGNDYFLIKNGMRYKFPSAQVGVSYGYNILDLGAWARIKQATPADLKLPEKDSKNNLLVLSYREGAVLRCSVDFQNTGSSQKCSKGKTYIVDSKNGSPFKREFIGTAFASLGYAESEVIAIDQNLANSVPTTDMSNPVLMESGGLVNPSVDPPKAVITNPANQASFNAPATLTFSASGSTAGTNSTISAYAWDFGDGTTGSGASITHTYAKAGSYTVKLTVTNTKGLIGVATITLKIIASTPPPAASTSAKKVGYNVYDWQSTWQINRDAIRRQKPTMLRWFISLDRYVREEKSTFDLATFKFVNKPKNFDAELTKPEFIDFLKALKESGTTLVVSNWIKDRWYTEFSACEGCWYPNIANYSVYMKKLEAAIKNVGVDTIWEPFNEPDLRWGAINNVMPSAGANENFHSPWVPYQDVSAGWDWWSGGSGDIWKQMHQITSFPQASGGITREYMNEVPLAERLANPNYKRSIESDKWRQATAPYITYFSVHLYRNNYTSGYATTAVADYVDRVAADLTNWSQIKGKTIKFYVGEIGPNSGVNVGLNDEEAKFLRDVHAALSADSRTKDSYMGMVSHALSDSLEEVDAWETRKGWWQPDYSASDVVAQTPL